MEDICTLLKCIIHSPKLPDDITLKNVMILTTCVIKDDGKFYPQLFLEEALFFFNFDNMYLTVESLIDINSIITGSNNIALKKSG